MAVVSVNYVNTLSLSCLDKQLHVTYTSTQIMFHIYYVSKFTVHYRTCFWDTKANEEKEKERGGTRDNVERGSTDYWR
jgi:hypothetical protein